MGRPWALYVEDETGEATDRFQREIETAGFEVFRVYSAKEARDKLAEVAAPANLVDLVVLDRKLPEEPGGRASEDIGDILFSNLEALLPDTPIVVLTGFSDEDFALLVLQRRNALDLGLPQLVQRVVHIRKGDSLRFREIVRMTGAALRQTEDVALEGGPASRSARRVLKRVGQLFSGAVVQARPAVDGASDSSVWLCDVVAHDGRWLTAVVVKIAAHIEARPSGGFMASVPSPNSAQPIHLVSGACGGCSGHVAPLAGKGARSLADLVAANITQAIKASESVRKLLDQIPAAVTSLSLEKFMEPLIEWPLASEIAARFDIELPDSQMTVVAHCGCLHGDLHPGNVLLDSKRPVFIDFDRQRSGALAIDSLSLALGAVFNVSGPLRNHPPIAGLVQQCVLGSSDSSNWFGACMASWPDRDFGERERWSALLAFALRQLKYPDVLKDEPRRMLAIDLARRASAVLVDS